MRVAVFWLVIVSGVDGLFLVRPRPPEMGVSPLTVVGVSSARDAIDLLNLLNLLPHCLYV